MPAPLRPIRVEKPENEVSPELELPEEDTESVIIHDDVDSESYLSAAENQEDNGLNHEQLIEQLNSGMPQLELLEEEEVLETDPGVQAEIDHNLEPDLVEPTPYNYEEGSSDYDSDSDNSNNPMTAPAA
jgi:hypothetical protein